MQVTETFLIKININLHNLYRIFSRYVHTVFFLILNTVHQFMVSFSVHRNWYVLSAPTKNELRDLRAISAIRIWTMISIIYGHATWFSISVPIRNPIFIEKVIKQFSSCHKIQINLNLHNSQIFSKKSCFSNGVARGANE